MYKFAIILILSISANAFDPLTVIGTVQTASQIATTISDIADTANEINTATSLLGELYSELDGNTTAPTENNKIIEKMRELEDLAREAGYTKNEIENLLEIDPHEFKNFNQTLRRTLQTVRAVKQFQRLIGKLEKQAQVAQIESLNLEREQLKIQHKLLNEQINAKLDKKKEALLQTIEKKNQIKILYEEINKKGGKPFKGINLYSFPKLDLVIEKAITTAKKTRTVFIGLVLLVFFIRLIYYQFGIFGKHKYGELIRDTIIFFVLMAVFPDLIHTILGISSFLSEKTTQASTTPSQWPGLSKLPFLGFSHSVSLYIAWLCSWIKYLCFIITEFLFNFGVTFLIVLFPLIVFISQLIGITQIWPMYFGTFLFLSLWPFFWNATAMLVSELWNMQNNTISDTLTTVLFSLFQFISPFVGILLLKNHSIGEAIEHSINNISKKTSVALNSAYGTIQASRGEKGGGKFGRLIGWSINQPVSRTLAAINRGIEASRIPLPNDIPRLQKVRNIVSESAKGFILHEYKNNGSKTFKENLKTFGRSFHSLKSIRNTGGRKHD